MRKIKLFLSLLMVMLVSVGNVWAADANKSLANAATSGDIVTNVITYSSGQGNGTTAPASQPTGLRIYKPASGQTDGGYITVTAASGYKMTSITFTNANDKASAYKYSVDGGSLSASTNIAKQGTFTYNTTDFGSITFYNSGGERLTIASIAVSYESIGGDPIPVLQSIAVSGTPSTKNYEAGEAFKVNGLVVTGTYDIVDPAPITEGITWSACKTENGTYVALDNEAVALAATETGIYVKATASGKISPAYHVTGLTVTAAEVPTLTFDFSAQGYTNQHQYTSIVANDKITISFGDGANDGKYYDTGTAMRVYGGGHMTVAGADGVTISKIMLEFGSGDNANEISTDGGTYANSKWTGSAQSVTFNVSGTSGHRRIKVVKVFYEVEAGVVAKPTITGVDNFLNSTTVTISHDDADAIYYTTNGDDPTVNNDLLYSAPFSLYNTATVKAIAVKGGNPSAVAEETFTKVTVLSVAQALEASTGADKYVKGIISSIEEVSTEHGNATYNLKDEGQVNSIKIYRGKYLNDAAFTAVDQIYEGDEVTVFGAISQYKGVNQFAQGNYIVLLKPAARLTWSEASFDAELEGANTFPSLTNTNGVTVAYSSSDETVATISSDGSTYELKKVGETTITASFGGNDQYKAKSVSYTLNVKNSVIRADISFEENGGSAVADLPHQTNLPSPLPVITMAGKNFGGWWTTSDFQVGTKAVAGAEVGSTEPITLYAKWLEPYDITDAKAVIDENESGIANQYVAGIISQVDEYFDNYKSITYWISDDGSTTDQIQVYSGKIGNAATALEKENFSSVEDLKVGDIVVVTGSLKKYGDVYEFDKNNTIYSFSRPVAQTYSITYEENGANETIDDVAAATNLPSPLPTVTKDEKIFGGWWTTSDFQVGTLAVAGAQLSDDVILYAKWEDLSVWATTYSSNLELKGNSGTKSYAEKVKITVEEVLTEFDALRACTGSAAGSCTVKVPAETQKLHFHAAAWNAKTSTITVTMGETELLVQALDADAGIKNSSPYTLEGIPYEYYYCIDLSSYSISEETTITFSAGSDKRFVLFGVNQEGGQVPVLQSLTISGDLENKEYEAGAPLNMAGLIVTGTYTIGDPVDVTNQVEEWLYDALQAGDETVTISAKIGDVTSEGYEITGLTVNDPTPRFETSPASISFGSVDQGGSVAAKPINVYLKYIDEATVSLGGSNPAAYSIDVTELNDDGVVTVSVNSTATAGSYPAKLILTDKAGVAQTAEISISLTVNASETSVSTTSKWIPATEITDGMEVLITGVKESVTYAMGAQANNNRTCVAGTLDEGVFTPGEGTKSFILVAQGDGSYAIKTSTDKYLYAAAATANQLKTRDAIGEDGNANWTISVTSASANGANRGVMRFNTNGNNNPLIACYEDDTKQLAIAFYVPQPVKYTVTFNTDGGSTINPVEVEEGQAVAKPADPTKDDYNFVEWQLNGVAYDFTAAITADITLDAVWEPVTPPTPVYETVRGSLTAGNYYTVCYNKKMTEIKGASLWEFAGKDASFAYIKPATAPYPAGKPYIVYAESDKLEAVLEGDAVEASAIVANGALHGTFSQMDQDALNDAGDNIYLIIENVLRRVDGQTGNTLPAYRAYIDLDQIGSAPANMPAHVRAMPLHKDTATGMDELNASETPVKVMINGQMYILRGEKMYDATGRLVK